MSLLIYEKQKKIVSKNQEKEINTKTKKQTKKQENPIYL